MGIRLEPRGEGGLAHFAGGGCEGAQDDVLLRSGESKGVHLQKKNRRAHADPLVSVDEGMIFDNAVAVACREIIKCRICVSEKIARAVHGGFQKARITQPRRTSVFRKKTFMEGKNHVLPDPNRFIHLASSLKAFR